MSSARNIASRSSFAEHSLRSRWKTASACASGWKISSCQPRKLLLHDKKEWSGYGKQAIEAYGSARRVHLGTRCRNSSEKHIQSGGSFASPCAYREPEDVSRRLHRAEMQYESQI